MYLTCISYLLEITTKETGWKWSEDTEILLDKQVKNILNKTIENTVNKQDKILSFTNK